MCGEKFKVERCHNVVRLNTLHLNAKLVSNKSKLHKFYEDF